MFTSLTRWLGRPAAPRRSHKSRPAARRPQLGFEYLEDRAVPAFFGAIYTTLGDGTAPVNVNIYDAKEDVYLNGGPQNTNSKGLPDGIYYFQVTTPAGALLSTDPAVNRQVQVVGGYIAGGYDPDGPGGVEPHPNGTPNLVTGAIPVQLIPYADTTNAGGEYKVWLIAQSKYTSINIFDPKVIDFRNSDVKTDNFKVGTDGGGGNEGDQDVTLSGRKFEDLNGDGDDESGDDPGIADWQITITLGDGTPVVLFTDADGNYSYTATVQKTDLPLSYTVVEENRSGWTQTYPGSPNQTHTGNLTIGNPSAEQLDFGNFENITLGGVKFYDVNRDGVQNNLEPNIANWKIALTIASGPLAGTYYTYTDSSGVYTFGDLDNADGDNDPLTGSDLGPGTSYTVAEVVPAGWVASTATSFNGSVGGSGVESGGTATYDFGNYNPGESSGLTIGFWSNKNGATEIGKLGTWDYVKSQLAALNLRNADGSLWASNANYSGTAAKFQAWLLNANATNMQYMLSAQLAATKLNTMKGNVDKNEYVYVGTDGLNNPLVAAGNVNPQGTALTGNLSAIDPGTHLIKISALIDAAAAQLAAYDKVTSTVNAAQRPYSEALKIVFDSINNSKIWFYDL